MKMKGLSIFLSDHRTAMHTFIYAQYMSQVVKDWQCSQVYNVAGDRFCLVFPSQVARALFCPRKVFRGRYHFLPCTTYPDPSEQPWTHTTSDNPTISSEL